MKTSDEYDSEIDNVINEYMRTNTINSIPVGTMQIMKITKGLYNPKIIEEKLKRYYTK